jgi:hypothetical protein
MSNPFAIAKKYLEPTADKYATTDPTEGRILAVKIASSVLDADIWLAFKDDFKPDEGEESLAVFYPDELPFLATKDAATLKDIHKVKLAFPGSRVRQ